MNSDEEREMFERHGWEYATIGRKWVSPRGDAEVSTDDLVTMDSPASESRLRAFVSVHGAEVAS